MRVLDVGAGSKSLLGEVWPEAEIVTVDLDPDTNPTFVCDCRELPDELGLFDVILASHLLEHIPRTEVLPTLREWVAHLEPGGALHIIVPDLAWAAEEIVRAGGVTNAVLQHIYGNQGTPWQYHHMGFTVVLLRDALMRAGLTVQEAKTNWFIIRLPGPDGDVDVKARQIYVIGMKPTEE